MPWVEKPEWVRRAEDIAEEEAWQSHGTMATPEERKASVERAARERGAVWVPDVDS